VELGIAGNYKLIAEAEQRTVHSAPSASFSVAGALASLALAQGAIHSAALKTPDAPSLTAPLTDSVGNAIANVLQVTGTGKIK
jgi:hypothetical protein